MSAPGRRRSRGEGFGGDYLEQTARLYARHGAEQIWWFQWRPTLGGLEIGMNGLQALDGSDSERTGIARKLAADSDGLRAERRKWLERKVAFVHYARASLLYASYWPGQLGTL